MVNGGKHDGCCKGSLLMMAEQPCFITAGEQWLDGSGESITAANDGCQFRTMVCDGQP